VLGLEIAIRCEGKLGEVGFRFVANHKQSALVFASTLELKVLARILMLDVELMLRVLLSHLYVNWDGNELKLLC
jgi:hypothetical protein